MAEESTYRVMPGRKASMGSIPAGLTTLSVSLIHGRFYAVALQRGAITGRWESPEPVTDPAGFGSAVKRAVDETGFRGGTVHLVLAHPRLTSVLTSIPAAKGSALNRVLHRQAQREKSFDGDAVWCHQVTAVTKGGMSVLLHLFPQALLGQYIRAAEKTGGLTLVSAVPASAVVHGQILSLPVPLNEPVMVAAALGDTTLLVVGQRDGQILLARSVPASWNTNLTGLLADVNRTLLFTKEQFGAEVSSIFLFGQGAEQHQDALQAPFQIPVRPSLAEDAPGYWATEVQRLPSGIVPNLIDLAQQRAPQRRAMLKVTAIVTALLVLVAMITLGWSHLHLSGMISELEKLRKQEDELQDRHAALRKSYADLLNKRSFCAAILEQRPQPMPAWVLGYLGSALPNELLLKDYSLSYTGEAWKARLQGELATTTNGTPALVLSSAVASLTNQLAQAPLHMLVTSTDASQEEAEAAQEKNKVLSSWAKRLRMRANPLSSSMPKGFTVEGVIR